MKVTPEFSKVNTQDYEDCLPASSEPSNLSTSTEITTLKPTKPEKRTFWQKCQTGFVYARPMLSMLIIDVGLPLLIYYVLRIWVSILIALILSGIPPLIHVIITFIRKRRINILGCVFVISYIISAVLSLVTGF
ncbi:hypothetical protein G6F56_012170 [Rhizopus delemar]|nr:hypothetical protein G6F56_012170 [Rhizopus delemar]